MKKTTSAYFCTQLENHFIIYLQLKMVRKKRLGMKIVSASQYPLGYAVPGQPPSNLAISKKRC